MRQPPDPAKSLAVYAVETPWPKERYEGNWAKACRASRLKTKPEWAAMRAVPGTERVSIAAKATCRVRLQARLNLREGWWAGVKKRKVS